MAKIDFSPRQLEAIKGQEHTNILVSAGAGSGKTTVMSERVTNLIAEGTPIDKFLILTFTDAAANSMKTKIREKISESTDPEIHASLAKVDEAHIETFDAFALWMVKKYAYLLQIDKDISIIDKGILTIKRDSFINETIDKYLANPKFKDLYIKYSYKDDGRIIKGIKSILNVASSFTDKEGFYNSCLNKYNDDTFMKEMLSRLVADTIKAIKALAKISYPMDMNPTLQEAIELVFDLILNDPTTHKPNMSYDALKEGFKAREDVRLPNAKGEEEKAYKAMITKRLDELSESFTYESEEDIISEYLSHREEAELFISLAREVEEKMDNYKREHSVYDFSDISYMANKLLDYGEVREEVSAMFTYIFIDEYQDTNDVQENVLNAIGRDNLYMVGDIKQSIYAFRNADCEIFRKKFNDYKSNKGGIEIDLNDNFRSRKEIVNHVNNMFSLLMDPRLMANGEDAPIDYHDGHAFNFGAASYSSYPAKSSGFHILNFKYPNAVEIKKGAELDPLCEQLEINNKFEYEAMLIAQDIIKRMNRPEKIYDPRAGVERKVRFSDFAILCRKSHHFNEIEKMFSKMHIPLVTKKDEESIDYAFGKIIKNLLKLINIVNDHNTNGREYDSEFIHAFASIYRSPVVAASDQDLYDLLYEKDKRIDKIVDTELYQEIEKVAVNLDTTSLSDLMLSIYESFALSDVIFALGGYEKNNTLWDNFMSNCLAMEKLGFTPSDYVEYFSNLDTYEISLDIPANQEVSDAVVLSTIHKAKGLEYHICYFPYQESELYHRDNNQGEVATRDLYMSKTHGLIFPVYQDGYFSLPLIESLDKREARRSEYYEGLRLLYVALTRAHDENVILMRGIGEAPLFPEEADKVVDLIDYSIARYPLPIRDVELEEVELENREKYETYAIATSEIDREYTEIVPAHASKELKINNPELLEEGTKVHYILECLDIEHPDLSFLTGKDAHYKEKIEEILSLPIFKGVTNNEIHHEYEFYDEVNSLHGVIDCLIERDDHIDIIDFKLKNINDEAYTYQVNTYRRYIGTMTTKPIHMYLLSINDIILSEVKVCNL